MSEVLAGPPVTAGPPGEDSAVPGASTQAVALLEPFRRELTGYCYRMLGSPFDAQDAVQETMIRAWRGIDRFEGRAALRSWLYRIATNVCLTALSAGERRARPMDLTGPSTADTPVRAPLPEAAWIVPAPDGQVLATGSGGADPADVAARRESVRLAFVVALQHLPARQRAVLILREVFGWSASETAQLLDSTVASVNSALQRARATIAAIDLSDAEPLRPADAEQQALLARYVEAFERYDMDALVALLHEGVTLSMPPLDLWLRGHRDVRAWMLGTGSGCRGSRLLPTTANGHPAFGQYRPSASGAGHDPWGLVVLEIEAGRVVGINTFLDVERLFPAFGLPAHLPPEV
ncbi:sigma-70 family RNA polymerase sigma factor [Parafrankia sp. EUN1f]|uniref:sigma-70 family RNA polymerase sigma factor n=1 Tax=Parafrankia sp. EUN1f TaxID=102897 RepID=UPI0001C45F56|nr:sigma-70 family RNA polymerase sigma factor [Parafrankia sp. EUN1f]EFC81606.1 RNA polymerase, sigma-24 subunit, ECF subfamily [Parafrankia sp. EUN1f]